MALVACGRGGASVTLAWTPPTRNVDGSLLRDLAGYFIYFGTDPKRYTGAVKVQGPSLDHYVVGALPSGTYYFTVAAYTASGVQSGLAPPVMKLIP